MIVRMIITFCMVQWFLVVISCCVCQSEKCVVVWCVINDEYFVNIC